MSKPLDRWHLSMRRYKCRYQQWFGLQDDTIDVEIKAESVGAKGVRKIYVCYTSITKMLGTKKVTVVGVKRRWSFQSGKYDSVPM
jgi:hypothetical protein